MRRSTLILAFVAAWPAVAGDIAPQAVAYDDFGAVAEPLTDRPGDPAVGGDVMTSRGAGNCIACHEVAALAEHPFHGEVGPPLDGVGGYRSAAELRGIVSNAKNMFPGTVMPAFYKSEGFIRPGDGFTGKAAAEPLPPLLTAQQIEDVVAFLMTLTE